MTKPKMEKNTDKLLFLLTTAARICYAKLWKLEKIPDIEDWLQKVLNIRNMDRLTYLLSRYKGTPIKETNWMKLTDYLKGKKYKTII